MRTKALYSSVGVQLAHRPVDRLFRIVSVDDNARNANEYFGLIIEGVFASSDCSKVDHRGGIYGNNRFGKPGYFC